MLRPLALLALLAATACSGDPPPASPSADKAGTATKTEPAAKTEPTPKAEPPVEPKLVPPTPAEPNAKPPQPTEPEPIAEPQPTEPEPSPQPEPEVDASGGTGNRVTLTENTKPTPPVTVGDEVVVELAASSQGIAPQYRFRWGDASVSGDALTFVKLDTRRPPPDVDGGHDTLLYIFRADRPGTSTITIPIAEQGPEAFAEAYRAKVTVKAR